MARKGNKKGGDEKDNRSLVLATPEESVYGIVLKADGNRRFDVMCSDFIKRKARICGRLKKKDYIGPTNVVLVSLRPGEDRKGDIVLKYYNYEVEMLRQSKAFPEGFETTTSSEYDYVFEDL